jgi:hypothetical protein
MHEKKVLKKRPCRICRRWFMPNPRVKDRQMTCGDPDCMDEWHRRKCREWNRKNSDYFRANYLQKKLSAACRSGTPPSLQPKTRLKSELPHLFVQEVISIQHLIIIEYFGQLLYRRFQEVLRAQPTVITRKTGRLPP